MSMFDLIINEADEKFNLGGKSGTLLSALLALMSDKNHGGFAGFLEKFNRAGLGGLATSWVGAGSNMPVSNQQLESALGRDALSDVAAQTGTDYEAATSATGYMLPRVVDALTPDGTIPQQGDFLTRIGGYLTGVGGATALDGIGITTALDGIGITTATATGGLPDQTDAAVGNVYGATTATTGRGIGALGDTPGAVGNRFGDALNTTDDRFDGDDDGSILKWLLPLLLLGLLIVLGYWFCGKSAPVAVTNANANANVNANANARSNTGNANVAATVNSMSATTDAPRTLTEVALPSGAKLQAYPGGIEDQLIKFIQSDEYKNANADALKDKWFSFDDLNFKFDSTEMVPESKRQLDNIVAILRAFPAVKIKIGGYTDRKGDDAANKKLSDSRAKAVKSALEKAGVGAQVPEAEGYGEEFATVAETAGDKEREADRKTSVRLLK